MERRAKRFHRLHRLASALDSTRSGEHLLEIALAATKHHDACLLFGPCLADGFLQRLHIAVGRGHGDVGDGKAGAVTQRMADFLDSQRAAGTGKKGELFDLLTGYSAVASQPLHHKGGRIFGHRNAVTRHRFAKQGADIARIIAITAERGGILRRFEQLHQRVTGCGVGRLDNDEGRIKPSCQRQFAGCQHFAATALDQNQSAGRGHCNRFGSVTERACIAGELVPLEMRH